MLEAARRNGTQWNSGKLKEHYEKLWAEAEAKEKADRDELAAMRAAAMAAKKSPEMGTAPLTDDAAKKPSATESAGEADAMCVPQKKSGTE